MKRLGTFQCGVLGNSGDHPNYWIQSLTVDLALHYWCNFRCRFKTALTPPMFAGRVGGSNPIAPIEIGDGLLHGAAIPFALTGQKCCILPKFPAREKPSKNSVWNLTVCCTVQL